MTDKSKPTGNQSGLDSSSSGVLNGTKVDALKREVMSGQRAELPQQQRDTRFKKGQSGNPKGRPKTKIKQRSMYAGELSIDIHIMEFANRVLSLNSGGKTRTMTGQEALLEAQAKLALGGNSHALKDRLDRSERTEEKLLILQAETADSWRAYKAHHSTQFQHMRDQDEAFDENHQLSHPDDVHISWDNIITFKGPMDKDQLERCFETVKLRNTLILRSELNTRDNKEQTKHGVTGADVLAHLMDKALPERMKLTEHEWFDAMLDAESMTKRQLLKKLRASWDKILRGKAGYKPGSMRRGFHFHGVEAIKLLYTDLLEYCRNLPRSEEPPSQDEIDDLSDIITSAKAAFAEVNA
ncbi:DUF5681 domain-containing protein [Lentilitoribacter sp. Alg239-R112]|uniref:DUF5681 domain-containing protein n=1 Tax=Lentilitoribacter sp. Alg239-R112 TaxID=2305987 RepID=UPI0013A6C1E2|nr:DUF5681 domain-containing protein [Lentilitoribacter sp. Alg239-R112]